MKLAKWCMVCLSVMVLLPLAPAMADFKTILSRMPDEANAYVIVDVDKVMKTNMAQRELWSGGRAKNNSPMVVPPGTQRLAMAGKIDLGRLASVWEVAVMDTRQPITADGIASVYRGFAETVADKPAAWTPINAYFIQLDPTTLGVVTPADRQFTARWVRQNPNPAAARSPYLTRAAQAVEAGSPIAMAIDMEDAASAGRFELRLADGEFESLAGKSFDPKALAKIVGGIKGLILRVDVADDATGLLEVDFAGDATALSPVAKGMLLEILSKGGMEIPDFADWTVEIQGTRLTAKGKLTTSGIRLLLSVIGPPSSGDAPGGEANPTDPASLAAKASQDYYQSISKILDDLPSQAALTSSAGWLVRDAKRIDQLTSLNVDPGLLAWGATTSAGLNNAAQICATSQSRATARAAAIPTPPNPSGVLDDRRRAELQNIQTQRRRVIQEEKTNATEQASRILGDLKTARSRIRGDMATKYKVEF